MTTIFNNAIFNELRLEGKLCDAVITVDGLDFKVHRIVLCNCSLYFRELFCRKNARSEKQIYSFSQVSHNIMNLIVHYAYTGSVVVTEENSLELLAAAERFAVRGILQICCDFLEQRLSFKNCVHIWMLSDFHRCSELRQKAYLYVLHHFEEVAGFSVKFLQLSVQQLADLMEKDELNVRQESTVFEVVLHWIAYDPEERSVHMATLLSKVRLLLMSSNYLVDTVSMNALVRKSLPCMTLVINAMKSLRESNMERLLTRTRLPPAVLLAVGGCKGDSPTNRMDLYNVRADRWVRVNDSGAALRVSLGCVFLDGSVYFIGGFDGVTYLSSVQKLNLVTRIWQDVVPMHTARSHVSVVALNGCIYAVGGSDGYDNLQTVERFQPHTNHWTVIATMHKHRSDASIATLHGKVYMCGGFNSDEPLSTAECYNPDTDQWTLIAPMDSGCNAARAAAYRDKIYVVGGNRDGLHTCRVIAYHPPSNQWSSVSPMINPHSNFGIAVLEDQLYVAGGFDNQGTSRKVERYDEKTQRWQVAGDMEVPRIDFSLCVVERETYTDAYLA